VHVDLYALPNTSRCTESACKALEEAWAEGGRMTEFFFEGQRFNHNAISLVLSRPKRGESLAGKMASLFFHHDILQNGEFGDSA